MEEIIEKLKRLSFLKPKAKVWWNAPNGQGTGVYEVVRCPFRVDEEGEIIKGNDYIEEDMSLEEKYDMLAYDIVLIANDWTEAEVWACELCRYD